MHFERSNICSERGFSLLETLVALFIFSVLGVIGVQILRSFTDGQRALAVSEQSIAQLQVSSNLIRQDLSAAIMRPVRQPQGGATPVFFSGGLEASSFGADDLPLLRFTRGGHPGNALDSELPSVQSVEYWFQNGSLVRKTTARPDPNQDTPAHEQILMSGLSDISLRFRVAGNWVDEVEHQLGVRQTFPELVEIRASFEGRGYLNRVFTVGAQS